MLADTTLTADQRFYVFDDQLHPDRRSARREPFPFVQPVDLPCGRGKDSLRLDVRCHDLSREGVSFWTHTVPDGNQLSIELGAGEERIRLGVRLCHATVVSCLASDLYLVGCQFVGN